MEQVEGQDSVVSVHKPFVGEIQAGHGQVENKESPTPANEREEEISDDGPRKDEGKTPTDNDIFAVYHG